MKKHLASARVLVATDNVDDAKQIVHLLEDEFEHLRASTTPAMAVGDFEEFEPDVLVLAFDTLDKAQRYYLGLYRASQMLRPHRTVILCDKSEVHAVVELCKKEYFDDYVLYWPLAHDGLRLGMSVWKACREMTRRADQPQPATLLAHVKHLGDLEAVLDRELTEGIDELKRAQAAQTPQAGATGVQPIDAWARKLRDEIEPAMAGTRALAAMTHSLRQVVMVVDDDPVVRSLIGRMLDPTLYEVRCAGDADAALIQLRRGCPDVVLMDVQLPGLDGVALTHRMKRSTLLAGIPIIMMTGDARRETVASSMEAGAAGFVVKPVSRAALNEKLAKVLSRQELPGRVE
ncbi:MAG: response regulator [Burkholderiales bacterium]